MENKDHQQFKSGTLAQHAREICRRQSGVRTQMCWFLPNVRRYLEEYDLRE